MRLSQKAIMFFRISFADRRRVKLGRCGSLRGYVDRVQLLGQSLNDSLGIFELIINVVGHNGHPFLIRETCDSFPNTTQDNRFEVSRVMIVHSVQLLERLYSFHRLGRFGDHVKDFGRVQMRRGYKGTI